MEVQYSSICDKNYFSLACIVNLHIDILSVPLPYNQKLIALAIVKHIEKDSNACYPKIKTIASIAGVSERQVRKTVAKLIEMKMLSRYRKSKLWCFEFNDEFYTYHANSDLGEMVMYDMITEGRGDSSGLPKMATS